MTKASKPHSAEAVARLARSKLNSSQLDSHIGDASRVLATKIVPIRGANDPIRTVGQLAVAKGLEIGGKEMTKRLRAAAAKKLTNSAVKNLAKKGAASKVLTLGGAVIENAPVAGAITGGAIAAGHGLAAWNNHRRARKAYQRGDNENAARLLNKRDQHKRSAVVDGLTGVAAIVPGGGIVVQAYDILRPAGPQHTAETVAANGSAYFKSKNQKRQPLEQNQRPSAQNASSQYAQKSSGRDEIPRAA